MLPKKDLLPPPFGQEDGGRLVSNPDWSVGNRIAADSFKTVKTHLEECTTRYLGFKCFLFSVYRVYPEVEDGRGTFDLACAFAVLFGVWKPGSVLLTAEVIW